jgi:hypothetical protein
MYSISRDCSRLWAECLLTALELYGVPRASVKQHDHKPDLIGACADDVLVEADRLWDTGGVLVECNDWDGLA